MPAPRIDTTRNQLTATRTLLGTAEETIEDLHALAYDRQTAAERQAVKGGERDYALDTHGDPRARQAYAGLAEATSQACSIIAIACDDAARVLNEGGQVDTTRGRGTPIPTEDLAQQLALQARRAARGDYTPVRTRPQPAADDAARVLDRVRRERDEARRLVERYHAMLVANGINPDTTTPDRKRGWRSA